eukprot:7733246-Karenia_brevis.AAC.1
MLKWLLGKMELHAWRAAGEQLQWKRVLSPPLGAAVQFLYASKTSNRQFSLREVTVTGYKRGKEGPMVVG